MIKVLCTSPTGSGLTFHQLLAVVQEDVSKLLSMVLDSEDNWGSEAEILLDEVAEKLCELESEVEESVPNRRVGQA